ncbi:type II/IV secretion system protein [Desertifilum sp. FACHB-1129]|uniref:General secretion pathway protein GspE n=1 Tax=Desertifilum tharense IPPAS B-1220 TaxID=1781255 RepID=A0A1E5QD27_9CYAN|nr:MULTISPECIES: GspE/PulE family protein [Desertifilum]MDA0212287.1 GspE/PulE family protein [Cyanobacteria bacterium FC1]MDK3155482.1 GspE/PulE family protein [Kamptonema cortianum]MBD2311384.1 type II/IV secretion system protein [Desertifilum sp. FACHB-1129]MBD2321630.1 type II/IV secretion system protein [Desertifilum sp. FACHB-866]MBD2331757.1 type II/IV secretion system protein [Desertifilum sp. FACHB-868]
MNDLPNPPSVWQQLKKRDITCDEAIQLLVDSEGMVKLERLDPEVSFRFWREFPDRNGFPPLIPLLLWRNCYYLGSPVPIGSEVIRKIGDRTFTDIKIISISDKSYRTWFHSQNFDHTRISAAPLINPLTGEVEQENISEVTELYLSKAVGQISRIKTIISGALRNRASDIHLEPMAEGLRVRYRIDGVLRDITTLSVDISRRVIVALKVMSNMDIAESRCPQDGRIGEHYATTDAEQLGMDMRVSTLPCVCGEKAVIRLLPRQNPFSAVEDLGFTPTSLEIYKSWLEQPQGMIILTGPTGSGKTSTLYTSLQAVATEQVNVVTVEDPVEYILPGITQTQVHERAGMTFAAGLRAILRQDPDIIMVGEIRDQETAETAVRAALTGHLVFTTLHTNDAVGAIPRLKDIGPDPGLISDALLGIVAQRLVRRVCPHCAQPYTPTLEDFNRLGISPQTTSTEGWQRGAGCSKCFHSGYLGREAIIELLDVDDRIRELIYDGTLTQLHRYLRESDFTSFLKAAIAKVTAGATTVEEVLRVLPRNSFHHRTPKSVPPTPLKRLQVQ